MLGSEKIQKIEKLFENLGIKVMDDQENYRDLEDIMTELTDIWAEMDMEKIDKFMSEFEELLFGR